MWLLGRVFAASMLVKCWQLVKMMSSSVLKKRLKHRMKINCRPSLCEERGNSAPPGHCHSNASGGKDPGEDIPPHTHTHKNSVLGRRKHEIMQRALPLRS